MERLSNEVTSISVDGLGWNEEEGRDVELGVSFRPSFSLIFLSLADHLYSFFLSQIIRLFPSLARQHICYPKSSPLRPSALLPRFPPPSRRRLLLRSLSGSAWTKVLLLLVSLLSSFSVLSREGAVLSGGEEFARRRARARKIDQAHQPLLPSLLLLDARRTLPARFPRGTSDPIPRLPTRPSDGFLLLFPEPFPRRRIGGIG
ncbi:hypothetical protein BDY24DRAFT_383309 [Mrakia frigida]|uniref:uncharacterized protein n=1 Tax=Mrakia frigida TaxID=29902 RepID=UPI003FCBF886